MAFGNFERKGGAAPMAEINMIPLIDVMLVLLVIFIITAPLLTHSVKVDLPKAISAPNLTKPDHIAVSIDASGSVYWNGEIVQPGEMASHLQSAATRQPQPELHLRSPSYPPVLRTRGIPLLGLAHQTQPEKSPH